MEDGGKSPTIKASIGDDTLRSLRFQPLLPEGARIPRGWSVTISFDVLKMSVRGDSSGYQEPYITPDTPAVDPGRSVKAIRSPFMWLGTSGRALVFQPEVTGRGL